MRVYEPPQPLTLLELRHILLRFASRRPEVARSKQYLALDGILEDLVIRILKDQPDILAESPRIDNVGWRYPVETCLRYRWCGTDTDWPVNLNGITN